MIQGQKNHRKMYGNVLYFFLHAGAVLLKITRIADLVKRITDDVQAVDDEAKNQKADTTVITRTRTDVKKEAATKAEALRGLVEVLTTDDKVKAALKTPVSTVLHAGEAGFLTYCQDIVDGIDGLNSKVLDPKATGYDPAIRDVLVTDLAALNAGTGEVVEMQKAAKAATDQLVPLFTKVDADLTELDKFVHFQQFAQEKLVAQYEALRVLPKTPVHEAFRAKGTTPYNDPQLTFNVLEHDVLTPTLYNDGGRGHEVVFYLGATSTSRPRSGQGLVLKNGKKRQLADLAELGNPATEPYLLVM